MAQNTDDRLAAFQTGQYLSIITYTKGGKEIATPVWFLAQPTKLFVATPRTTYKIKRIKNDARVKVAPCSRNGDVQGTYIGGTARLMDPQEEQNINDLFRQKYGLFYKFWSANLKNLFRGKQRKEKRLNFIEITPTS